jgi:hypothetical protein
VLSFESRALYIVGVSGVKRFFILRLSLFISANKLTKQGQSAQPENERAIFFNFIIVLK